MFTFLHFLTSLSFFDWEVFAFHLEGVKMLLFVVWLVLSGKEERIVRLRVIRMLECCCSPQWQMFCLNSDDIKNTPVTKQQFQSSSALVAPMGHIKPKRLQQRYNNYHMILILSSWSILQDPDPHPLPFDLWPLCMGHKLKGRKLRICNFP